MQRLSPQEAQHIALEQEGEDMSISSKEGFAILAAYHRWLADELDRGVFPDKEDQYQKLKILAGPGNVVENVDKAT
jgi:hypothetical protein